MRLKHLQPGIHLPHAGKHRPGSTDASSAELTAAVDGCRAGAHLLMKGNGGNEGWRRAGGKEKVWCGE